jgi:MFS family permease
VRNQARTPAANAAITFFLGIASFGLVLTLFLQLGLGFTPLHAGLTFLPFSLGVLASSGAAARLAPRFGRGVTMAGALIIAAGMTGLIVAVHHYGAAVTTWELVPGLVGAGLGLGAVIAPLADIVLDRVPHQDAGSASGVFNTGLQLGNSIGIAVIGVIFFALLGAQSGAAANTVAPALRSGAVAARFRPTTWGALRPGSAPACTTAWWLPTRLSRRRRAGRARVRCSRPRCTPSLPGPGWPRSAPTSPRRPPAPCGSRRACSACRSC